MAIHLLKIYQARAFIFKCSVMGLAFLLICMMTTLIIIYHNHVIAMDDDNVFSISEQLPVDFNRYIQPILSNKCFACHGPDTENLIGGLQLSNFDTATEERRGGRQAIVPGNSAASLLMERIQEENPNRIMPPPETHKTLSSDEIELLRRWIDEGATFEEHWAYRSAKRYDPPIIEDDAWGRNSVDRFVKKALLEQGLTPSPEADRITLIRRLSYDLLGLPPTAQEVDAFVSDNSDDAYERLVDRLLASPHYGERLALYWLDLVRYADTTGYHGDQHRDIYPYRDYVIEAFNNNKPFDQFTIEQLAGDLLPDATLEQLIASGYNRLNQTTAEGGAQEKEYLAIYAADRVRTTSSVWMGATLGCAQCHDHKFDPFTIDDFYSFSAFFAGLEQPGIYNERMLPPVAHIPNEFQADRLAVIDNRIATLQSSLETPSEAHFEAQQAWETRIRERIQSELTIWEALSPSSISTINGTTYTLLDDHSFLASGENPTTEHIEIVLDTDKSNITGIRLEALKHESIEKGLSRANGNFVLTRIEVEVSGPNLADTQNIQIRNAEADFEQDSFPVLNALDGKKDTGWAVAGHIHDEERKAAFYFMQPVEGGAGTQITVRLHHEFVAERHVPSRIRLSLSDEEIPTLLEANEHEAEFLAAALKMPSERTEEEQTLLTTFYNERAPEMEAIRSKLRTVQNERNTFMEGVARTLISKEREEPRVTRVLPRGNWLDDTGEIVNPAIPEFLGTLETNGERASRLDLAKWLVHEENPLTARVFVNRLWYLYFGSGLSKVLDDLGLQGEWPSHPELLDWLACEFVDSGWDVKHMVRLLVTSSTYRQQSNVSPQLRETDPFNRLLARQTRFRLPAEMVRDNALRISGLLTPKIGGPSVYPYQPDGYWDNANTFAGPLIYKAEENADQYRRGLYTYWKRTFLHPSLLAFDAPNREECVAERSASNTPLQALVLLNDPVYVEAARVFATRIVEEGGDTLEARLDWAFRHALSRSPNEEERSVLGELYKKHIEEFSMDTDAAMALVSIGNWPAPSRLDVPEVAAWTSVARVIFNLHETITRT